MLQGGPKEAIEAKNDDFVLKDLNFNLLFLLICSSLTN